MSYANRERRGNLIAGLRALADFLETNPEVPAPYSVDIFVFPSVSTDDDMRAEVDQVAVLIGSEASDNTEYNHYSVTRKFGSAVEYQMLAVLGRARAFHEALMSYSQSVIPDSDEEA